MSDNNDYQKDIRKRALDLLARREHAPVELEQKLLKRDYLREDVAVVLDALMAENLLSATRYAESKVNARIAKGIGPVRIRSELARVQIDESDVVRAFAEVDADWFALANSVRRKRFGADLPIDYKERTRQMRFLQQRGFDTDCIRAAVEEAGT